MPIEPIGVRLRRERQEKAASQAKLERKILTLDEQIKQLESNIDSADSNNSSESEEDSDSEISVVPVDDSVVVEQDESGHVKCIKSKLSGMCM